MYDVIVVGARCAGSPTAMLLARQGLRVLLVDRARFPSDVISTHCLHPRGATYLNRWGLLQRVLQAGTPTWPIHTTTLEGIALTGAPTAEMVRDRLVAAHGWRRREDLASVAVLWCAPRRRLLDTMLAEAAASSGAELRLGFTVEELVREGDRVVGIRGHSAEGAPVLERARVVVGADGRHSMIARAVQAAAYHERSKCTYAYYSYWSGFNLDGLPFSLHVRGRLGVSAFPTNDGLIHIVVWGPREWFHGFRANIERHYLETIEFCCPPLLERIRASGKREERFYGTADQPGWFRRAHGPGWALVGDAAYHKDQCTAIGMTHAFRDAEFLAEAITRGLAGQRPLDQSLADYERRRDEDSLTYYDLVCTLAESNTAPLESLRMFAALRGQQDQINRFFAVFGDAVRPEEFFAPENVERIYREARTDIEGVEIIRNYEQHAQEYARNPWG